MTSTAHEPPNIGDVAAKVLREEMISTAEMPAAVRDAASDYQRAVMDVVGAGKQLEVDRRDLHARRDLIPSDGFRRLGAKAVEDARLRAQAADRDAVRALSALEESLVDAALPKLDPKREQLARDEAKMALGSAGGNAIDVATRGSLEAVAALASPWGETLLESHGVTNAAGAHRQARRVAASIAVERGGSAREILAGKALRQLPRLAAAKGTAGGYVIGLTENR